MSSAIDGDFRHGRIWLVVAHLDLGGMTNAPSQEVGESVHVAII